MNRPTVGIDPAVPKPTVHRSNRNFPKHGKMMLPCEKKKYYTTPTREKLLYDMFWFFVCVFFVAEAVFPKLSDYETLQGIKGMPPTCFCWGPGNSWPPENRSAVQRVDGKGLDLLAFRLKMY